MGKIRIRTIGDEEAEKKEKKEAKKRKVEKVEKVEEVEKAEEVKLKPVKKPRATSHSLRANTRSKSYQNIAKIVDKSKKYALNDALGLLEQLKRSKFDETVELHINTTEQGVSGNITLPHGTGKTVRVAIATDELIDNLIKGLPATPSQGSGLRGGRGKIEFDILLADPSMMPKLARVAKILGPKGLMPNPKNGTLVKDPAKSAENFKKGQISFKTESKTPIIHIAVGKVSFGPEKLSENIHALLENIQKDKIKSISLSSTMSPGIKISL